jgi:hypothetical protein
MAFRRLLAPVVLHGDALTRAMVGIGMNFAAEASPEANIEDTLLCASVEAMDRDDLRVLAVLVQWFGVHHAWVNADRLVKLVGAVPSPRVRALWSALASWQRRDRRFARWVTGPSEARVDLLGTGDFLLRRHGEDPRFGGSCLRVPAKVLRDRPGDVLTPAELAQRHHAYRLRVMVGPTYRADLWALLQREPALTPAELARRTHASFASAWKARQDFRICHGAAA